MANGMPSARTIKETDIPAAIRAIKQEIRDNLRPRGRAPLRFSIAIDGGSSKIADGVKLITVIVMSPDLPHEYVLGIEMRASHEDSVSQADFLVKLLEEYGLNSAEAVYLVGDNASVNEATVDLLTSAGWWVLMLDFNSQSC